MSEVEVIAAAIVRLGLTKLLAKPTHDESGDVFETIVEDTE